MLCLRTYNTESSLPTCTLRRLQQLYHITRPCQNKQCKPAYLVFRVREKVVDLNFEKAIWKVYAYEPTYTIVHISSHCYLCGNDSKTMTEH